LRVAAGTLSRLQADGDAGGREDVAGLIPVGPAVEEVGAGVAVQVVVAVPAVERVVPVPPFDPVVAAKSEDRLVMVGVYGLERLGVVGSVYEVHGRASA
jgi:hypothetical protein